MAEGRDPANAEDCPFCPGNEPDLAELLHESPAAEPGRPWGSRAVLNRYPFLAEWDAESGEVAGHQEVLIDGPAHAVDPPLQSVAQRRSAVRMWRMRVRAARRRDSDGEIHLFRNHGRAAGSSRSHPHAQLVHTRAPTPGRSAMLSRLAASASCLLCEAAEPERCVVDGPLWTAHTLAAPLDPDHLRIVPVRHVGSLADVHDGEVDALADLLGPLTAATGRAVGCRDYSLIVHETDRRAGRGRHLHIELRPRVGRSAGFEQSSEVGVCEVDPIVAADRIRQTLRPARSG